MPESDRSALDSLHTGPMGTPIEPRLILSGADEPVWDERCDVLVVGCGFAGAATALKAAEQPGRRIAIIDRFDGGGASQASGGVLYLGGTSVQHDLGIPDDPQSMSDYLAFEVGDVVSREALDGFCRESAAYIPWLAGHGVRFGGPLTEDKTNYPSTDFLYYSGNERLGECKALARPASRGHRAKPRDGSERTTGTSGPDLMIPLKAALDRADNIAFHRRTSAHRLICAADGRVIGVECRRIPPGSVAARLHARLFALSGNMMLAVLGVTAPLLKAVTRIERKAARPFRIRATRAVVLAGGGFAFNHRLLQEAAPDYRNIAPLGTIGDDGSAIMLGRSAGGALDRMDTVSAWRFLYPPQCWPQGVLIDKHGQRLLNEESYGARVGAALFERSEGLGWLILDAPLYATARKEAGDPNLLPFQKYALQASVRRYAKTADTLGALATAVGVPADAIERTIADYNDDIAEHRPDRFGKSDTLRREISTGPFTAIDLSHHTRLNPILGITVGGLRVEEATGAVVDDNGVVVPGLYAAGRSAVGLPSNLYVSGLSLSDCIWSGWRAARAVAAQPTIAEAGKTA